MKYRKHERERAEMLKIDEKTALLDDIIGTFVKYDDSPRRGVGANIIINESPEKFEFYFRQLYDLSCKRDSHIILLTAWNEWGEGAYLEPDEENGYAYLEAVKRVVDSYQEQTTHRSS